MNSKKRKTDRKFSSDEEERDEKLVKNSSSSSDSDSSSNTNSSSSNSGSESSSSNSSSSSSSSSSSDTSSSENEEENTNSNEIKLKKFLKFSDTCKQDLKNATHKLEKLQRALKKAELESNRVNIKKCKKYIAKYDSKIERLKKQLKQSLLKINELKMAQKHVQASAINKRSRDEREEFLDGKRTKISSPPALKQQQIQVKIPYPVVNDQRDLNTILTTLESKSFEIMKKRESNRKMIDQAKREKPSAEVSTRLEKLHQLEQAYDAQQDKLVRQIEYVKMSLNLDALRARSSTDMNLMMQNAPLINSMTQQLNEMYAYMKNENINAIKKHKEAEEAKQTLAEQGITLSPKPTNQAPLSPTAKLSTLVDIVNNSLAALLAHTAASAHSTAAITSYAYSYYNAYYGNYSSDSTNALSQFPATVPPPELKTEIEKASQKFSKIKDKISSFFTSTKKIEHASKKTDPSSSTSLVNLDKTGLSKLLAAYGANKGIDKNYETSSSSSSESSDEEGGAKNVKSVKTIANKKELEKKEEEKKEEEEGEGEDADDSENDYDLEIVTTSELKSNPQKFNYLLPSLKASYFPLKASLDDEQNSANSFDNLIVAEKSKYGLTLLGNANFNRQTTNRKLSDILYSQ